MNDGVEMVVFDLGGVVMTHTAALGTLADLIGVPTDRREGFEAVYYRHRLFYDLTSDAAGYWSRVAADGGAPGVPDDEAVAELVRVDNAGWSVPDPATLVLIDDLVATGIPLALLSNAPRSMGAVFHAQPWSASFGHAIFSGDVGVVKPDRSIFLELLRRTGLPAAATVFIDDRDENVSGARDVGLRGIRFTDAAALRTELIALGLPFAGR